MRGRRLLFVSLLTNLALAVGCLFLWYGRAVATRTAETEVKLLSTNILTRTKLLPVVRKQFFSWSEIESPNYLQYIRNLRDIGCPEQTVRDIIVADVNLLYAKKRAAAAVITNEQSWWSSDYPHTPEGEASSKKVIELESERRGLLVRLLGTDWQTALESARISIRIQFDGPVLTNLPDETKQKVCEIMTHLRTAKNDSGMEYVAWYAQLEGKVRNELAGCLTPPQLEEFLLRYSDNAGTLRGELGELKYFNTAPDEFRSIFRATDGIDTQIKLLGDSEDPAVNQQIKILQQQREAALKASLTPQRYAEYVLLRDPAYVEALTAVQDSGGSLQTVQTLYAVNQEVAAERERIEVNTNLTDLQRQIELKKIELAQLQAQARATGQVPAEAPPEPVAAAPTTSPLATYSMIMGDTVKDLSQRFGISMSAIRAANPNLDLENLRPGDKIRLPEPSVRQPITPFSR